MTDNLQKRPTCNRISIILALGTAALLGATALAVPTSASAFGFRGFGGGGHSFGGGFANRSFATRSFAPRSFVPHNFAARNFASHSFAGHGWSAGHTVANHAFHSFGNRFASVGASHQASSTASAFHGGPLAGMHKGNFNTLSNPKNGKGPIVGVCNTTSVGGIGNKQNGGCTTNNTTIDVGGGGGFPVPVGGGGGGGPGSPVASLVPAPAAPTYAPAPTPVNTPVARPYAPAPTQSCFRKTYQDQNIVLMDVCTQQQVLVPPGGNECLVEQDAQAGSVWFADKCAMQQVLTPPAAATEALSLIFKKTAAAN